MLERKELEILVESPELVVDTIVIKRPCGHIIWFSWVCSYVMNSFVSFKCKASRAGTTTSEPIKTPLIIILLFILHSNIFIDVKQK